MSRKFLLSLSAILGALAVILGAMGAHYLKSKVATGVITLDQVVSFDTGVKYQMYHTIVLLSIGIMPLQFQTKYLRFATYCFLIGILLFSGSIYLLSTRGIHGFTNISFLGPITPIGGLFFVGGWLMLLISALKSKGIDDRL